MLELLADLREVSAAFTANLDKAAIDIQAQKNDLEARARFVKELHETPDLSKYCDLNQVSYYGILASMLSTCHWYI